MFNSGGIKVEEDNTQRFLNALDQVAERALTIIGIKAEKYAKGRCPVGTPQSTGIKGYRGGTLRNSITFQVTSEGRDSIVVIGSNVEYAPYVELGTGPYFKSPPYWEQFSTGPKTGTGHSYVKPRPYLKPAIEDHIQLYTRILNEELKKGL